MNSTIDKTLEHVWFLARHLKKYNIRGAVIVMLMELGVPTKCVGFELLVFRRAGRTSDQRCSWDCLAPW